MNNEEGNPLANLFDELNKPKEAEKETRASDEKKTDLHEDPKAENSFVNVPKTTVEQQDYTFDSFIPEYKRPCLTDPEVTILVKVLNQSAHFYRVNGKAAKDRKDEVSAGQFENMAIACDGLAVRFNDLLNGKRRGRVKGSALRGKRMCFSLAKEFKG